MVSCQPGLCYYCIDNLFAFPLDTSRCDAYTTLMRGGNSWLLDPLEGTEN